MFENYLKQGKNIFDLVKAADFFDIPSLLSSVAVFIAKEYFGKDSTEIRTTLVKKHTQIPYRFTETILYHILKLKDEHESYFYQNSFTTLNTVLSLNEFAFNLTMDEFNFLYDTTGDYVKYNSCFINIIFPNVELCFARKEYFRFVMKSYLDDDDLHTSLIAGGLFINYQSNSLIAKTFPELFQKIKQSQDIDIFILDEFDKKFQKYYFKIFEPYCDLNLKIKIDKSPFIADCNSIYEGLNTFKIQTENEENINFIFVNKNEFVNLHSFLNTFDFSISKIHYNYELDAIFIPIELFEDYDKMYSNKKGHLKECVYVISLLKCHRKFGKYVLALESMLDFLKASTNQKLKYDNQTLIEKKSQFERIHDYELKMLGKCSKILIRIFKYSYKNYFKNQNDAQFTLDKLTLFYKFLKQPIITNSFSNEIIIDAIFQNFFL